MFRRSRFGGGFTLLETILAGAILSGSVLALSAITTRSLNSTRLNRQYETATTLAERQLAMIDYAGLDAFLEADRTEGDIEQLKPGYHWKVTTTERSDIDNLYTVNITVSWVERRRSYSISFDTMLASGGGSTTIQR